MVVTMMVVVNFPVHALSSVHCVMQYNRVWYSAKQCGIEGSEFPVLFSFRKRGCESCGCHVTFERQPL